MTEENGFREPMAEAVPAPPPLQPTPQRISGLDTATSITNPDLSLAAKLKNKNKKK